VNVNFPARPGLQLVPVETAVHHVGVLQVQAAAHKVALHLLTQSAHRLPRHALQLVVAGTGGHVDETVPEQLHPPVRVLVPHLHVQPRPPLHALGAVVQVDGVGPRGHLVGDGAVHVGLPLLLALYELPRAPGVHAPLAEKRGLVKFGGANNAAYYVQLRHC